MAFFSTLSNLLKTREALITNVGKMSKTKTNVLLTVKFMTAKNIRFHLIVSSKEKTRSKKKSSKMVQF